MHAGIDPGTRNIGVAITDDDGKLVHSQVFDMVKDGLEVTINNIVEYTKDCSTVCIERFVPYQGKHSKASEKTTMLIGGLAYAYMNKGITPEMYRAIDWKIKLCKYLVRNKDFDNPSSSFDKRYSIAAAKCITGISQKEKLTTHEGDAACLSYMWKTDIQ